MRRADGLVDISRRDFCSLAAGAVVGTAFGTVLVSCVDGDRGAIQTGGLNGSDGTRLPDASSGSGSGSGSGPPGDAMNAAACTTTATDVGPASMFMTNKPVYFSTGSLFVVRDSGGLYALTARCTHEGVPVQVSGSDFVCPRHLGTFTFTGAVVSGPVFQPLVHYAMCTLSNGHIGVVTSMTVSSSTRLAA